MRREHPLRILRYSARNLWLLGIPLLRSLPLLQSPTQLLPWLRGVWMDLLVLLWIVGYGWLRWFRREYSAEGGILHIREGILLRRERWLPVRAISLLECSAPFWGRPLHLAELHVIDMTGAPALRLFLRERDAARLRAMLPAMGECAVRHRVSFRRLLLFSVLCSSSLSGAAYAAVFWMQGREVLAELPEALQPGAQLQRVAQALTEALHGLPPAAAVAGMLLGAAWGLSLLRNLLRFGRFAMETDGEQVQLRAGLFTVRRSLLQSRSIQFLELRQNLPMLLLRQYALSAHGAGTHNARVCLPLLRHRETAQRLPRLLPGAALQSPALRPERAAWWSYLWAPVTGMAAVLVGVPLLRRLLPQIAAMLTLAGWLVLLPLGWKLLVQLAALQISGISEKNGMLCLRGARGQGFRTLLVPRAHIAAVQVVQYPWQRRAGLCHLRLTLSGAGGTRFWLRSVRLEGMGDEKNA